MIADDLSRIAMSPSLGAALARAGELARRQGHLEVALEHMLLSLCEDPEAGLVLASSNIDTVRLKNDVVGYLAALPMRGVPGQGGEPSVSADLRRILEAAAAAARGGRRREINGAIVLAAIVGDGRSPAAHLLQSQGLTFEGAIRALQRGTSQASRAPSSSTEDILASARERVQSRTGLGTRKRESEPAAAEDEPAAPEAFPFASDTEKNESSAAPPRVATAAEAERQALPEVTAAPAAAPEPAPPAPLERALAPARPMPFPGPGPELRPAPAEAAPPPAPFMPAPAHAPPPIPGSAPGGLAPPAFRGPPPTGDHAVLPSGPPMGAPPQPMGPPPIPRARPGPVEPPPGYRPAEPRRPMGVGAGDSGSSKLGTLAAERRMASAGAPSAGTRPVPAQRAEIGQLIENIPRTMRVAVPAMVEVRIAKADVRNLAEGLQGGGAAYQHEVTVTKAMAVRLRAPDGGFFIETASPETQWIDRTGLLATDDFASWRWHVTPREKGKKRLQLIISARTVGADGLAAETALPDQVITVRVKTNYAQTASHWMGWGVAALAGGLLARFGEGLLDAGLQVVAKLTAG